MHLHTNKNQQNSSLLKQFCEKKRGVQYENKTFTFFKTIILILSLFFKLRHYSELTNIKKKRIYYFNPRQ